jgi:acyl dehydratase
MGKFLEQFVVGEKYLSQRRTVTETDIVMFTGLSWDTNPAHTDEIYSAEGQFKGRIAHGALTLAIATGLNTHSGFYDGTAIAFLGIDKWEFVGAVFAGDTLHLRSTVLEVKPSRTKPDRGAVKSQLEMVNQRDEVVQRGLFNVMVRTRGSSV